MVVCESVPTSVSGKAQPFRSSTTRARYSRLTWWTMPVFGGTTRRSSKASWPQRRNAYRSRFRSNSSSVFLKIAIFEPNTSTWTEWSMTSSDGRSGLIRAGSPPRSRIASRMAARSTIAGTPVKSWSRTRAGRKEISRCGSSPGCHSRIARASCGSPSPAIPARTTFSRSTRSEYGRRAISSPRRLRRDARYEALPSPSMLSAVAREPLRLFDRAAREQFCTRALRQRRCCSRDLPARPGRCGQGEQSPPPRPSVGLPRPRTRRPSRRPCAWRRRPASPSAYPGRDRPLASPGREERSPGRADRDRAPPRAGRQERRAARSRIPTRARDPGAGRGSRCSRSAPAPRRPRRAPSGRRARAGTGSSASRRTVSSVNAASIRSRSSCASGSS